MEIGKETVVISGQCLARDSRRFLFTAPERNAARLGIVKDCAATIRRIGARIVLLRADGVALQPLFAFGVSRRKQTVRIPHGSEQNFPHQVENPAHEVAAVLREVGGIQKICGKADDQKIAAIGRAYGKARAPEPVQTAADVGKGWILLCAAPQNREQQRREHSGFACDRQGGQDRKQPCFEAVGFRRIQGCRTSCGVNVRYHKFSVPKLDSIDIIHLISYTIFSFFATLF